MPYPHPTRRLPSHPSLEQLRKQAKDLLDRFRAGDPDAVAEVTRFEHSPDLEAFRLADAQRVLARAYGYESWPKLKAFVDGANIKRFAEAVQSGDLARVRALLRARPELVGMDMAGNNEHRALHYAVLRRDAAMVRLLMESGADARKGIFPHRDATSPIVLARDREYQDIVAVIEQEEQRRHQSPQPDLQDRITRAILTGDRASAIQLLESDPSLIDAPDRNARTPLHYAAQEMDEDLIAWLLLRRAIPILMDADGLTPLDRAARAAEPSNSHAQQFPAIARQLLAAGAEITVRAALALNDASRVTDLVQRNPTVLREIHWMGGGLLSLAVNHGHFDMVKLLLDLGADVDERTMLQELEDPTESWGTPLWFAALAGRRDIAELLLDRGADPNANVYASGWALRNAQNHEPVKQLLLARGAKPQPYMVAEAHDVEEARRMLDQSPANQELARELAWSAADHGCPAIVELALHHLPWPSDDPRWHWILVQPIRGAVDPPEDFLAAMEILLKRGIVNVPSQFGETALHYAAARHLPSESTRVRFAAMLLDHRARLDTRDALLQSTPLGWACRWGRKELVELLLARGASPNEPDAEPWASPLAWAAKMNHPDVAALL